MSAVTAKLKHFESCQHDNSTIIKKMFVMGFNVSAKLENMCVYVCDIAHSKSKGDNV